MRAFLLIAGIAGCHFVEGHAPSDGREHDGRADDADLRDGQHGDPDTPPGDCVGKWSAGPTFGTPIEQTAVDQVGQVAYPFVSADEETLYIGHAANVYVATRASATQFGTATFDDALSTNTANEYKVAVSADGLDAYITSGRGGSVGNIDIWHTSRGSTQAPFNASWNHQTITNVDSIGNDWDPHISVDKLHLYLAPGDGNAQHVAVATRTTPTGEFSAPDVIPELRATNASDYFPTLSGDERVIVFESTRGGGMKLYYAVRSSPTAAFGDPAVVALAGATQGHLSTDACRLYYIAAGKLYVAALN